MTYVTFCTQINQILNTYTLMNFHTSHNPAINFLKFLSPRVILSYKPFSYRKGFISFIRGLKCNFYWNEDLLIVVQFLQ